jgi:hypothetical protein
MAWPRLAEYSIGAVQGGRCIRDDIIVVLVRHDRVARRHAPPGQRRPARPGGAKLRMALDPSEKRRYVGDKVIIACGECECKHRDAPPSGPLTAWQRTAAHGTGPA